MAHLRAHRESRGASRRRRPGSSVLLLLVRWGSRISPPNLESGDNSVQGSPYAVAEGNAVCHGPVAGVFAPYGSSGWLIYRLDHREPLGRDCANSRAFIFGEVVLIGPRVFGAYLKVAAGTADALDTLHRYRASLVWQTRQTAPAQLLCQSPR